jgi:4'-phosphopantetheinyl transferase
MKVLVSEDIWEFDLEAALGEISAQRREQALRFRYELGQRLCVLAYRLLKQGLRETYDITENPIFEYNEHGKPSIAGHPEIFFNLSHCKKAAVCAISDHPVGIDVESIREYKASLVRYTMNDDEVAQILQDANPHVAFIRLWTQKEAVLKLAGTGIMDNIKTVLDGLAVELTTVVNEAKGYIYSIAT